MSKNKNILTTSDLQTETAIPLEAEVMLMPIGDNKTPIGECKYKMADNFNHLHRIIMA